MKRNTNKQHTITKYPPWNYVNGCYTKDEWTDYSDIGKIFDDKLFTLEEYLLVEQKYVNVILTILDELHCKYIRLDRWFKNDAEDIKESRFPNFEYPSLKGTAWEIGASMLFSNVYLLKLNPIFMLYYWLK